MVDTYSILCNPIPFFTVENIMDTIAYVEEYAKKYTDIYIEALEYVKKVLKNDEHAFTCFEDLRLAKAALAAAGKAHDKLISEMDFCGSTRWRYITVATAHYIRAIQAREAEKCGTAL